MEENSGFVLGNKEYTNQELLEVGIAHYPKKYWIKRGIGLGLIFLGLICVIPLICLFVFEIPDFPYKDVYVLYYRISLMVTIAACIIPGIVFTILSFIPEKNMTYIEYAKRYLVKQYNHTAKVELKKMQQLNKLQKLLDSGAISQAEFDSRKKYIEERM